LAETSLVPHGKILSTPHYRILTLPNLPNLKCPVSGVHSTPALVVQVASCPFSILIITFYLRLHKSLYRYLIAQSDALFNIQKSWLPLWMID